MYITLVYFLKNLCVSRSAHIILIPIKHGNFSIPGFRRKRGKKKREKKRIKKIKPGGKWHVESFKYQLRCLNTPTRRSSVYIAHIRRTKIKLHTPKSPTRVLEKFPCFPTICVDRGFSENDSTFSFPWTTRTKKKKKRNEKRERERKKSLEISIFERKKDATEIEKLDRKKKNKKKEKRHEEEIEDR